MLSIERAAGVSTGEVRVAEEKFVGHEVTRGTLKESEKCGGVISVGAGRIEAGAGAGGEVSWVILAKKGR